MSSPHSISGSRVFTLELTWTRKSPRISRKEPWKKNTTIIISSTTTNKISKNQERSYFNLTRKLRRKISKKSKRAEANIIFRKSHIPSIFFPFFWFENTQEDGSTSFIFFHPISNLIFLFLHPILSCLLILNWIVIVLLFSLFLSYFFVFSLFLKEQS